MKDSGLRVSKLRNLGGLQLTSQRHSELENMHVVHYGSSYISEPRRRGKFDQEVISENVESFFVGLVSPNSNSAHPSIWASIGGPSA